MIKINNSESSNEESDKNSLFVQTNDWLKDIFYSIDFSTLLEWIKIGLFIFLWILFSTLSINESLKCENKIMFIVLSLIPIVNVIMYLTINKICNVTPINRNGEGYGVDYVRNTNVYPSSVYNKLSYLPKKESYLRNTNKLSYLPKKESYLQNTNKLSYLPKKESYLRNSNKLSYLRNTNKK